MTQDFKKLNNFFIFSYYWLLLKSYHIIQILIDPIGVKKMFSGSQMKIHRKIYGLNGFDAFFSHFTSDILVFACFDVVLIVIGLIVMSHLLPMHDKHNFTPIGAYFSVFIDCR